jgi:hypothetical protein
MAERVAVRKINPMTFYRATFTGVSNEAAESYEFEAGPELFSMKAHDILVTALESIERSSFVEHHDYEIHAVYRGNSVGGVVGIGYLVSGHGEIPFTISVYKM